MTSNVNPGKLLKLIENGSKEACLKFFARLPPDERRVFAKPVLKKFKEADAARFTDSGQEKRRLFRNSVLDELENAKVCVFATATRSEILKLGWRVVPNDGFILPLIRALRPSWTNDWINELIESVPRMFNDVRLLYQAGLCEKPTGDGYILGMINGLPGWRLPPAGLWNKEMSLADRIRTTPDIRDNDVWRLFEVEGGGDLSLAAFDKYVGGKKVGGWTEALTELGADGTLSRDRLLDASLSALERDFAQFRAGWFSRFHEYLEPTLKERIQRRDHYLSLLGSSIPPTVSFALKAIVLLDKANELPPKALLTYLRPVLQARAKGTVMTGLRLLGTAAKRAPELTGKAARLAADALIHEATDVQQKALSLIETLDGNELDEVIAAMQNYADGIAPSLQGRFHELVGHNGLPEAGGGHQANSAASKVVAIVPIGSFDELNREFLRVIENPDKPLDVERVLDGLARYGAVELTDFDKAIGPLRKRANEIVKRQPDDRLQYQLAKLAMAYSVREDIASDDSTHYPDVEIGQYYSTGKERELRSFENVFLQRNSQILKQLKSGRQLPLLSAPTDNRGYVAAATLIARYNEYRASGIAPGNIDMALALMRLSPDQREEALNTVAEDSEFDDATRYALGGETAIGKTGWLWVAAAAARLPYEDQPSIAKKHGLGNPDAGTKARYGFRFRKDQYFTRLIISVEPNIDKVLPELHLPGLFHVTTAGSTSYGSVCGHHVNMIRWCSTVWPLNQEPFFSQGIFVFDHSQRLANTPYAGFIEPMLGAHVRIGSIGCWLLALGLASNDPAVRSVALDAAIASIDENRLDAESMRQAMAALVPSGHVPVGRWTKSLAELGAVSETHMVFVRDLIAGSLRHDPAEAPRGLGGLVELLYELCIATATPLEEPNALKYLLGVKGGGKLKRFAGRLLAQV